MPEIEYLIVDYLSIKDITRIFTRIKITDSGCWEWTGTRLSKSNYGVIRYQHTTELVHRLLYAWAVEKLPKRKRGQPLNGTKELDHLHCSNKTCVNPVHLKLVTHKFNSLRSNSPMAINARKTHCPYGHELPETFNENYGEPTRRCLPCRRDRANERYRRNKSHSTTSQSSAK